MLLSLHLTQNYVINGREKTMRLIDAEKFEVFNATCPITKGIRSGKTAAYFYGEGCRKVLEAIDAAPTIDPESLRPTAHWKRIQDVAYMCTYCKSCFAFIPYNYQYCPECGAKMLNAYAFARER